MIKFHDNKICNIFYKKLHENGQVPERNKNDEQSAGWDVKSGENVVIKSGEIKAVGTGIACEIPEGTFAMIVSRSGLSLKGIVVNNAPGIIDSSYRGEWKVIIYNQSKEDFEIKVGDRIAQCLLMGYHFQKYFELYELSETSRGSNGFGSSGVN